MNIHLPDVTVFGIDVVVGGALLIHIETRARRPGSGVRCAGPGEGPPGRGAGGLARVRSCRPPNLARVPVALPRVDMSGWQLNRGRGGHRRAEVGVVGPGLAVGH